jgi:CelD/BcsL family acetyltransferase involved in cellulose biosynthesis
LPTSWDDLLARLSKSRRGKIRAQERRFLESGRAAVKSAEDEATLRQGLDVLHRLHQARRESLGDDGCFTVPRFERFLEDAAGRLQRAGQLRLQWLEVEGQPAAVEFDLLGGDTLYYYQTGMNPDLAEISPGWLLQIASLKAAMADGLAYFDFLRGDEEYKLTWGAEPRPLVQIRIAARRPLARLRQQLWIAALRGKTRWQNRCGKKDS